ncbi:GNAT family N-acetyltransferase [Ornithinimicrobium cerasi]|uniref:Ribosomal-protein-alanine N-acetyltransferase n=1 Tax=Ornithinimicrobium cerasi TaxID=2248773 RepID=A0A285VIQ1_9MICO|nr:GNAT family protein [Ornithinimicrobium cerasi]SOC53994.1 ribosomal-protein-alanine N-acetyltransferase [Ornithinimicrobium cerasi]
MSWAWPVTLRTVLPGGRLLTLRPLERADRAAWEEVRARNDAWLAPWESLAPGEGRGVTPFGRLRRGFDRAARDGAVLPFVVVVDGTLVGSMHLFDVMWGSRRTGSAGYWLDRDATGHGYATWALALLVDHALLGVGLHRVEVNIRPENTASLAVVRRLAIPEEAVRRGLMHVDGAWRDHRCFAVVAEDLQPGGYAVGGLVELLRATGPG